MAKSSQIFAMATLHAHRQAPKFKNAGVFNKKTWDLKLWPREHSTIELYMYSYNHSINTVTLKDVKQYLQQYFPNRDITLTKEGLQKKVLPLEKVILRAIKRNVFMFDNGQLIIPANSKELEVGTILHNFNLYYTLSWNEIEQFIVKYKRNGERIKNLRQTRRYYNNNTNTKEAKELDKNVFGIK